MAVEKWKDVLTEEAQTKFVNRIRNVLSNLIEVASCRKLLDRLIISNSCDVQLYLDNKGLFLVKYTRCPATGDLEQEESQQVCPPDLSPEILKTMDVTPEKIQELFEKVAY